MKVSLAWIFDHIDAHWMKQDVDEIITKFNQVTAEVEGFEKVQIDLRSLFIAVVTAVADDTITLTIPELGKEISLPSRPPTGGFNPQPPLETQSFLIFKDEKDYRWATVKDVGLDKEGLLPAFDVSESEAKGGWRNLFESEDILLDVDNKSLTHRPDMWGHRGFAREIAAYLKLPFLEERDFLTTAAPGAMPSTKCFESESIHDEKNPFKIEIAAPDACKRFSGLYISAIENKPSNLLIASRLLKVGVRPINGIVDLTNYVMLDWSQPVHAYDAKKLGKKSKARLLVARHAKDGEKLTLLDGQELTLMNQDLVIADGDKAVGLAGVMGGLHDSISMETDSIFFESAHFVSPYIRRTSMRYGVRTDSSARFEKTLDPNQITLAIRRFVVLCEKVGIKTTISSDIICVGKPFEEKTIGVSHLFLEKRAGVTFEKNDIVEPLTRLGFIVSVSDELIGEVHDMLYTITIPSYRGAKDVQIKEDILEEVVRCFGFNKIALQVLALKKVPCDLTPIMRRRKMKNFLVSNAKMTEQQNYIYYDEDFLSDVGLKPAQGSDPLGDCLSLKNPVSINNSRIASSLLPNLFKNVKENCVNENRLRFFELGRSFRLVDDSALEEKNLAGIFFEKRNQVDFYECKQYIVDLLKLCDIGGVVWKKIETAPDPWTMPYQSAELFFNEIKIGVAGKIDKAFLSKLDALPESDAFYFVLNADRLFEHQKETISYSPISKFQDVTFDLCFMVPLTLTVEQLEATLFDCDDLIKKVELVDFFGKKEWLEQRSVAFRLWLSHPDKTLEKEEIDSVRENALLVAKKLGATLRE